jgi:ATP-binding cassette subfamily B protein
MAERSTIVIAHRPATIALAERVVLLDRGRVEAAGTHQELLAVSVRYGQVLAAWAARDAERDAAVAREGDGDGDGDRAEAREGAERAEDVGAVA